MSIETQACTDGFRILLLEVWDDRANGVIVIRAGLYDGGRRVEQMRYMGSRYELPPEKLQALTRLIFRVAAEPHVLAGYGRGWKELLVKIRPDLVEAMRLFDLRAAATAMDDRLSARSRFDDICIAYGIFHDAPEGSRGASALEDLLWAVLGRAAERGLKWDDVLNLPTAALKKPDFSRYDFNQETIRTLPPRPGVYVMRDRSGKPLYVGKAAHLARRVSDYFKPVQTLPEKVAEIRARIHTLEIQEVGSELEALLTEHKLIQALQPAINVQQDIAEGTSRYHPPLTPVVVFEHSTRKHYAELFFFGKRGRAIQFHMNMKKPPWPSLRKVLRFYLEETTRLKKSRSMVDWGPTGAEICIRYFTRYQDRLYWTEIRRGMDQPTGQKQILDLAQSALESDLPGEFRM